MKHSKRQQIMIDNTIEGYPYILKTLSNEEGGGFLIEFPDLPGCMSDGDNITEVFKNAKEVLCDWIAVAKERKRKIPKPFSKKKEEVKNYNGRILLRTRITTHKTLVTLADEEEVSLNSLINSFIEEKIGELSSH